MNKILNSSSKYNGNFRAKQNQLIQIKWQCWNHYNHHVCRLMVLKPYANVCTVSLSIKRSKLFGIVGCIRKGLYALCDLKKGEYTVRFLLNATNILTKKQRTDRLYKNK